MKNLLLVSVLALATFTASAQTDTNAPVSNPIIDSPVFGFLSHGSNFMVAPYGIVNTTDGKYGGGVALAYKINDFVAPMMRVDYYDGTVWMPSASLQLQASITLFGKFTVVPFAFSGIGTPIAGKGKDNGTAVGIFGAGLAARVSTHFDLVADVEKWSGFNGQQIRFGVLYKF